jgi:hypothetical protein
MPLFIFLFILMGITYLPITVGKYAAQVYSNIKDAQNKYILHGKAIKCMESAMSDKKSFEIVLFSNNYVNWASLKNK